MVYEGEHADRSACRPLTLLTRKTSPHSPLDRSLFEAVGEISRSAPAEDDLGRLGLDGVEGLVLSDGRAGSEARDMLTSDHERWWESMESRDEHHLVSS